MHHREHCSTGGTAAVQAAVQERKDGERDRKGRSSGGAGAT